jgi:tetratricopeptide (TPR) repeat protein
MSLTALPIAKPTIFTNYSPHTRRILKRGCSSPVAYDTYSHVDSTYNPNYIAKSMAMCYDKLGQTDLAKDYFEKAWGLNAEDAYSANSLVKIQVKEEDYTSAYQNSEKFIEKDSTNATMNALNAFVYYNLKRYDIAVERFQKCLLHGDSSLIVNRSLGFSYFLGDMDSVARPFLQQAFLQDTTNNNVLYILGKVNHKLGYYQEAVECFSKMAERLTSSEALLYAVYKGLAEAYEKNGAFQRALDTYETTLKYASDNKDKMEVNYQMALIIDKELKDNNLAILHYQRYRTSLFNYQNSLTDESEIQDVETRLIALDEYIDSLKKEK